MPRLRRSTLLAAAAFALAAVVIPTPAEAGPSSVAVVGSMQSEAGCGGDWDPSCTTTDMTFVANGGLWRKSLTLPAGTYDYKVAIDHAFAESYPAAQLTVVVPSTTAVVFYYDPASHWVTSSLNAVIVTAPGSFQSELGCGGDWDPSCLWAWLTDPDGDGTYTRTVILPAGTYETKAAINESFTENYGAGGVAGGPNIPFTVPAGATSVVFSYVAQTHVLTVTVNGLQATPEPSGSPSPGAGSSTTLAAPATLPATGQYNVRPIAVAGAAVLLIGIVLVIATRRWDGAKH